jgi:hypothetical protein
MCPVPTLGVRFLAANKWLREDVYREAGTLRSLSLTLLKQQGNKSGKSYISLGKTCQNFSESQ